MYRNAGASYAAAAAAAADTTSSLRQTAQSDDDCPHASAPVRRRDSSTGRPEGATGATTWRGRSRKKTRAGAKEKEIERKAVGQRRGENEGKRRKDDDDDDEIKRGWRERE